MTLVCLDIDGTLTDGINGPALPGAVEAVAGVRHQYALRFVTNATSRSPDRIAAHLRSLGLLQQDSELYTPLVTAQHVLEARGHARGILLADPQSRTALSWFDTDPDGPSVLVATEGHPLTIAALQPAVRRLLDGAKLYCLQRNRYFRQDGEIVTDLGPLVAFLEYASGVRAETMGKPSPLLFDIIAREAGCERSEIIMVGDDMEFDASASVALGMRGIAVRTGKYRKGDETKVDPRASAVLDSIVDLPAFLEQAPG